MGPLLCAQALPRTLMWKEPPMGLSRQYAIPKVNIFISRTSPAALMLAAQAISQSESDALRAIT
jgi:hypothetical protein